MDSFKCDLCGAGLIETGTTTVGDTPYMILECKNCHKKIVKRLETA